MSLQEIVGENALSHSIVNYLFTSSFSYEDGFKKEKVLGLRHQIIMDNQNIFIFKMAYVAEFHATFIPKSLESLPKCMPKSQ